MDLDRFDALARARRTNLRMDPDRPVPDELVAKLCRLATWAPNHKRTWPWRFAALRGDARARLGEGLARAQAAAGASPEQVAKSAAKYLRAPLILVVACAATAEDPVRAAEDRDAVAAATQTLLLGATAAGLASYWGTGAAADLPATRELCGFGPADVVVALIYLGWPAATVPAPERPEPWLRFVS